MIRYRAPLRTLLRVVVVGFAGTAGSCAEHEAPPTPSTARYDGAGRLVDGAAPATARPNVVWLCLDTTRADGIVGRGGKPPSMPAIAAFCAANTRFVDAQAHSAWTAPCVTSQLTGLLPRNHGVKGPTLAFPLVSSVATMAEYFRSAGYTTAAFTGGGWVSEEMGLGQGFDSFRPSFALRDPGEHVERWLKAADRAKPWFLFLHTYEAHDPFGEKYPPEGEDDPARVADAKAFCDRLAATLPKEPSDEFPEEVDGRGLLIRWRGDPLSQKLIGARFGKDPMLRLVLRYTYLVHAKDPRRREVDDELRARYDHGLGIMDRAFARFLAMLDAQTGGRPTVFVLTSDHGESLGENGNLGHGRWLTEVLTKMLFVVRAPGRLPATEVRGSAGGVDVLPTILDLAGLPVPDQVDGRSLVPLARGTDTTGLADRVIEAEEYRAVPKEKDWRVLRLTSVRTSRAKVVVTSTRTGEVGTVELFDLVADPGEERPLPADDVSRYGPPFVAAVARAKERLAEMQKEPLATGNWR